MLRNDASLHASTVDSTSPNSEGVLEWSLTSKARANWLKDNGTRGARCTLMGVLLVTLKGKGRTVMCVSALGSW